MAYNFQVDLLLWLEQKGISRKELIALLQSQYYEEFKGLDTITLSRWLTGKSTPPLYKQFYIARCLDVNLKELILSLDISNIKYPNKYESFIDGLGKALDFSMSVLSYRRVCNEITSEILPQTYQEHINLFGDFYSNVSALKNYKSDLYEMKDEIKYKAILIKNSQGNVISHWSGIMELKKLNNMPSFISIPQNEIDRSCLINVGYYINSKTFFELIIQALCLHILKYSAKKDYLYCFNLDCRPIVEFCKSVLNAEEIKYYHPTDTKDKMGVYLLKFDIIKVICNPLILPKIKQKLLCVSRCAEQSCDSCNLSTYNQH